MKENLQYIIEQFTDFLLPDLTPYEAVMYIFLLRNSYLKSNSPEIRIGKRTIAENFAKGSRGDKTNYAHVTKLVKGLESKGCIKIGDTTRDGTLYTVLLPNEIPLVKEKLLIAQEPEEDYFTDLEKRNEIFKRDRWMCFYCGEK